jgi:hypothetical protein
MLMVHGPQWLVTTAPARVMCIFCEAKRPGSGLPGIRRRCSSWFGCQRNAGSRVRTGAYLIVQHEVKHLFAGAADFILDAHGVVAFAFDQGANFEQAARQVLERGAAPALIEIIHGFNHKRGAHVGDKPGDLAGGACGGQPPGRANRPRQGLRFERWMRAGRISQ